MHNIKLACYTNPWGKDGFIQAIKDIGGGGFDGVEYSALYVESYLDRLHVFQEIINREELAVVNLLQGIDLLDGENSDLQVERGIAAARFIAAAGAKHLTIFHEHVRAAPPTEDEWGEAGKTLDELAERVRQEHGLQLCYLPRLSRLEFSRQDIFRLLAATNPEYVKIALDTAEITQIANNTAVKSKEVKTAKDEKSGKNIAVEIIREAFDRIGILRFRDVSGAKRKAKTLDDETVAAPRFGRGAVDFPEICRWLEKLNYRGWLTVDFAGEAQPAADAMTQAFRYLAKHTVLMD
ncbi:hypothetical protein FACS1894139_00790 [Planctomycetales bacterium]|nr:hypothetical protein FACS1894107_06430 [Planctomycetales bacterium]GHT02511.1 hypothetical protein FACS1894139_00790 [Planctomycetales bacterium]